MSAVEPGAVFEVRHPFVRESVSLPPDGPECGFREILSWRPGVLFGEPEPPDGGSCDAIAHGIGAQVFTIVSIHRPGKYPPRVFYVRQWRSPQGKLFGKRQLRVTTLGALSRRIKGYRHPYEIVAAPDVAPA